MGRLASWGIVCAVVAFGCKGREREPGPPLPPECWDDDGDGYGEGVDCLGPDCAPDDAGEHVCDCAADAPIYGCPCQQGDYGVCFGAPAEAAGVGQCAVGFHRCRDEGFWSSCEGEVLPVPETCNGLDDDCDGEVDEDFPNDCTDCLTGGCSLLGFGVGEGLEPFVAEGPGLDVTPEGALTLTGASSGPRLAWIPSTLEGTISKIDTRTFAELGRYRTGPLGASSSFDAGEGDVPAFVAVSPDGDAIVANRAPLDVASVTRVLADDCRPGDDGVLSTSAGHDVLAWGEDDCVLWHTDVGTVNAVGRAVVLEIRAGLDGTTTEMVWLAAGRRLFEIDGRSGEATGTVVDIDRAPSSAAIDPEGWIWLAEIGGRDLLRFDPLSLDSEGVALPADEFAHDVAVDRRGDVWTAGSRVLRYRPSETRWEVAAESEPSTGAIAVDAAGVAWTLDDGGDVQRVEETAGNLEVRTIPTGAGGTGIAIDNDGLVWAVGTRDVGVVTVLDAQQPEQGAQTCCDFVRSSYARGDLTGAPRFAGPVTWAGRIDSPARDCPVFWKQLDVLGTISEGVRIVAEVRAGDSEANVEAARWLEVAEVPPDAWPVDVGATLEAAGQRGPFLDVRLTIDAVDSDELPVITAVTVERVELCF